MSFELNLDPWILIAVVSMVSALLLIRKIVIRCAVATVQFFCDCSIGIAKFLFAERKYVATFLLLNIGCASLAYRSYTINPEFPSSALNISVSVFWLALTIVECVYLAIKFPPAGHILK